MNKMDIKKAYGEEHSKDFKAGDIVEWSRWDSDLEEWSSYYGIIVDIKNQIVSNRLVSISTVVPVEDSNSEIEFFSFSLKLVSRAREDEKEEINS